MEILAHRGEWSEKCQQNTMQAFELALNNGYGIETDLRDLNQNVVISHDMPADDAMLLERFLAVCAKHPNATLALNIKADGLQQALVKSNIDNPHFYFDMSVPDSLGFIKNGLRFYTRSSDIEQVPCLYKEADGIWLDNFSSNQVDLSALKKFLDDDKFVVLVSPELHKLCEKDYWREVKDFLNIYPHFSDKLSICTDYPSKAKEYFNVD
ncbi:hypothetical protein L3Q72_00950 [Vibrio sp. JC009]|uniref:hypothetical protein n=1 Tax=Vibrio sp. JC009 TaxID=2912314 RepID=UPI0023AFEDA3|nr:hypothetical protein [Vibrio sp. JC009]WED22016.1 hypothetical protein L3Q72_00950 [Vibrio sp. JC009]